ncbi:MAG: histidine phosphatase family protein, partial [Moraxellaceae bacterium]
FWQSPEKIQPPNGEHLGLFAKRVISAWEYLTKNPSDEHHLIVCHGGTIRIIIAHILRIDWRNAALFTQLHINYNSITRIELTEAGKTAAIIKCIGAY